MTRRRVLCGLLLLSGVLACFAGWLGKAPASSDQERVAKLIQQLAGSRFAEREQAMKDLIAIGAPALDPLRSALKSNDPELVRRALECIPIIERNVQFAALIKAL